MIRKRLIMILSLALCAGFVGLGVACEKGSSSDSANGDAAQRPIGEKRPAPSAGGGDPSAGGDDSDAGADD